MAKPVWIVFEGIDGSGKTTQAKMLDSYLNSIGIHSLYMHVFETKIGREIRKLFLDSDWLSNTVEILLLCASRRAFLDEIETIAAQYDVIIVDRFYLSILAMQGKSNVDRKLIQYIRNNTGNIDQQAYLFYIDVDPVECKKRLSLRADKKDRIERQSIQFHREVEKRYKLYLSNENHVIWVDGNSEADKIHSEISQKVLEIFTDIVK